MVARVRWAVQVSQGSVETFNRWGGKHLYHFETNLFRKRCTKFHQNRLKILQKTFLVSFFLDTLCMHVTLHACLPVITAHAYPWQAVIFYSCSFFFERHPRRSPNETQPNFVTCSEVNQIRRGKSKIWGFFHKNCILGLFYDDIATLKRKYLQNETKRAIDEKKEIS